MATKKRKRPRAVWLVVNVTKGLTYGGEWEARRKDALHGVRHGHYGGHGDDDELRVVRAVVEDR